MNGFADLVYWAQSVVDCMKYRYMRVGEAKLLYFTFSHALTLGIAKLEWFILVNFLEFEASKRSPNYIKLIIESLYHIASWGLSKYPWWTLHMLERRIGATPKKLKPWPPDPGLTLAFLKVARPILSALHFQGPKSNIHVHFHWVNKQLIGISFSKWNRQ